MALDATDVAEGTMAALGLGIVVQAVEDRATTTQQADLWTGVISGAAYVGGLALMHSQRREGGGAYEVGEALAYGAAALLGAEGTRYVDHNFLKLTTSGGAANVGFRGSAGRGGIRPPAGLRVRSDLTEDV